MRGTQEGVGAVVEATGAAGDVLIMHPLLVHAVNDARRVTFHLAGDPTNPNGAQQWKAVQHGIRVTFNLSTNWVRQPLTIPDWDDGRQPRSLLEHSLVAPIARGLLDDPEQRERVLNYGELVEIRFVQCGMMIGVHDDCEGLAFAWQTRIPSIPAHHLQLHAPDRPNGGDGQPVCYGDELVLQWRAEVRRQLLK